MLLGLPIDGHPVCGPVDPASWRDKVDELIGICPSDAMHQATCSLSIVLCSSLFLRHVRFSSVTIMLVIKCSILHVT
jgi:hypothetical protein